MLDVQLRSVSRCDCVSWLPPLLDCFYNSVLHYVVFVLVVMHLAPDFFFLL